MAKRSSVRLARWRSLLAQPMCRARVAWLSRQARARPVLAGTLLGLMHLDCSSSTRRAALRLAGIVFSVIVLTGSNGDMALAVVNGKSVSITAAPWTVAVEEYGQFLCTGVIIDPSQVLTAGHCAMSDNGESARSLPASLFTVEAGVSNFNNPLSSDHPQLRSVSAVRVMPGYIAARRVTLHDYSKVIGHDLAVLTLSYRLDLHGATARAASLPGADFQPPSGARLVTAGFGQEKPGHRANGTLNKVLRATFRGSCGTSQILCASQITSPCLGDSGSGVVEVQPRPTVVGIFSEGQRLCKPGFAYYVFLGSPAALSFIQNSMRAPIFRGIADRSADTHTVIRPLPAVGIICEILGVLGAWRIRRGNERKRF